MAKAWTATRIAALPPRPTLYSDPAQPGLYLKVRAKAEGAATRTWMLRYKFAGSGLLSVVLGHFDGTPAGMSLDAARAEARSLRELASRGIDPAKARPRRNAKAAPPNPLTAADTAVDAKHSVAFLVADFMEHYVRAHYDQPEQVEGMLNRDVLPEWKGRDARTITPREVHDLLDKIVNRGSKVMANRVARMLTKFFKWGIHRQIVDTQPVQLLFAPGGKEQPKTRYLRDNELGAFLVEPKSCTRYERLARVLMVLLLTGQRRKELARARWSDIDWTAKTWMIQDMTRKGPDAAAKEQREHVIPLSDWAVKEFEGLHRLADGSPWVLPTQDGKRHITPKQITRGVAKCLERFAERGIAKFTPHDLRRTCRTNLSRLKVPYEIRRRIINHATVDEVDAVYDQWQFVGEKREALDKWAALLESIRDAARAAGIGSGSLPVT